MQVTPLHLDWQRLYIYIKILSGTSVRLNDKASFKQQSVNKMAMVCYQTQTKCKELRVYPVHLIRQNYTAAWNNQLPWEVLDISEPFRNLRKEGINSSGLGYTKIFSI